MSMAKAADVASLSVRPVRSSEIQSAFGTQTPDVVPFHVKHTSWSGLAAGTKGGTAHAKSHRHGDAKARHTAHAA